MGIRFEIDGTPNLVIATCLGTLDADDARLAIRSVWKSPEWRGKAFLWDFREARFELSASDVREIAQFVLENQPDEPPEKLVFVTARDVDFGLSRMFEVFRSDPRTAFRVSRDYDEALDWARSPEPDGGEA